MTAPTSLSILSSTFPDSRERGFAIGLWGAAIGAALAAGPPVGGLITQYWYWGGVFLVNVPLGAAAVVVGLIVIAPSHDQRRSRSLGLPGVTLSLIGLLGISYALISLNTESWHSTPVIIAFAGAMAAWLAFVLVERKMADPLIHTEMFRDPVYTGGAVAIFFWAFAVSATSLFISLYLQTVLHFSPLKTGIAYLPMAVLTMAVAPATGRLARKLGVAVVVATGYSLAAGGYIILAELGVRAALPDVLAAFSIIGIGTALTMPMQSAVIGALPARWSGVAGAVLSAARTMASLVGVAVGSAIVALQRSAAIGRGSNSTTAYVSGYTLGLKVAVGLMLAGTCVVVFSLRKRQPVPLPMTQRSELCLTI
jgi:predicted MFS family arabinose efflux permease